MEIVIRFIGIILFVSNTADNKQTYDVYLPDLAEEREITQCKDNNGVPKARSHTAAIRVRSQALPKPVNWGFQSCSDGVKCKLFILPPSSELKIKGVTQQNGVVSGDIYLRNLPHLLKDNFYTKIVMDHSTRMERSAAYLKIDSGTIESDRFSNDQGYATLYVHLANKSDVEIIAGPNSLTIPAADFVTFDIVNSPTAHSAETSGIPKTGGGNDFLAYYLFSAQDEVCTTPGNSAPARVSAQMTPNRQSKANAAAIRRVLMDDDDNSSMSSVGGNADCSSSSWP